jgi:hypothetical protein
MKIRFLSAAVITAGAAVAAPMLCAASQQSVALDSCTKAFVASLATKYEHAPKLRESRYVEDGSVTTASQMTLTATDARDNRPVARAVCTVNAQGEVTELHEEPLTGFSLL